MQTDEVQFQKIQASNDMARKRLQTIRSGLQRMMKKKTTRLNRQQPAERDTRPVIEAVENQYYSTKSGNSVGYSSTSPQASSPDFGFNSTLFRQINDDTVIISNSSGLNPAQLNRFNGAQLNRLAYNSVPSNNEYFSTSSKQSGASYEVRQDQGVQVEGFRKSSKLFSQIEQLMSQVNKTAKMPVKHIQKYFDKLESKKTTEDFDIEMPTSTPRLRENKSDKLSSSLLKRQEKSRDGKARTFEQMEEESKKRSASVKEDLKNAQNFLKTYKNKAELLLKPPLPPGSSKQTSQKKISKAIYDQSLQEVPQKTKQENLIKQSYEEKQLQRSGSRSSQNSVEHHKNKIRQTLNERKKIRNEEGMLDDSIDLQLSEEEDDHLAQGKGSDKNKEKQIEALIHEKKQLLEELKLIEQQLEELQAD